MLSETSAFARLSLDALVTSEAVCLGDQEEQCHKA